MTARYETRDGVKGWKPIRTTADGRLDLAAHFTDADRAVPADELFKVTALKNAAKAAPEGRDLPHARGLD